MLMQPPAAGHVERDPLRRLGGVGRTLGLREVAELLGGEFGQGTCIVR